MMLPHKTGSLWWSMLCVRDSYLWQSWLDGHWNSWSPCLKESSRKCFPTRDGISQLYFASTGGFTPGPCQWNVSGNTHIHFWTKTYKHMCFLHTLSHHSLNAGIWDLQGADLKERVPESLSGRHLPGLGTHLMWTRNKFLLYLSYFGGLFLTATRSMSLTPYQIKRGRNPGHFGTLSSCPMFNSLPSPIAVLPK